MIFQKCPSCGEALSPIAPHYDREMTALCDKYDVDSDRISSQPHGDPKFNAEKTKIMDKYVTKERLCCRMASNT